jgi:hypothetical protein
MLDTFKIVSILIDFSEKGAVPYVLAAFAARTLGLACEFEDEYGPAGNWVSPQTGTPIGIDTGELFPWLEKQAA